MEVLGYRAKEKDGSCLAMYYYWLFVRISYWLVFHGKKPNILTEQGEILISIS